MGHFNFECVGCGWGRRAKGDKFFGMTVMITARTKTGKTVYITGVYDGYGDVEVVLDGKEHLFYSTQFKPYWDSWCGSGYVCEHIFCEECMDASHLTPLAEFSKDDFTTLQELRAPKEAKAAEPVKKVEPKPKAKKPTKSELEEMVAEMSAELERLRPLVEEVERLKRDKKELQGIISKVRDALD